MKDIFRFLVILRLVISATVGSARSLDGEGLALFRRTLFPAQQDRDTDREAYRAGFSSPAFGDAVRTTRSATSTQVSLSEFGPLPANSWSTNLATSATQPGDFDDDDNVDDGEPLYTAMNIQHFRASANGSLSQCVLLYMTDRLGTVAKTWLYQVQTSAWLTLQGQMPGWNDEATAAPPYTKRIWPASVTVPRQSGATDAVYVLGGATFVSSFFDDVWRLDGQAWSPVTTTGGAGQLARFRHSAAAGLSASQAYDTSSETVFIFGGQKNGGPGAEPLVFLNDVWKLSITEGSSRGLWTLLHSGGPANASTPVPRAHAELASTNDGTLLMFGGWTLSYNESRYPPKSILLRDLWEFNPTAQHWTALHALNEVCEEKVLSNNASLGPSVTPPGTYLRDLDILVAYTLDCTDEPVDAHKAVIHIYSRAQRSWSTMTPIAPYDLIPYTSLHSVSVRGEHSFLILRRGTQMRDESHFAPFQLHFTECSCTEESATLNNSMLIKLNTPPSFLPAYDTLTCMQVAGTDNGILFAVGGLRSTKSVREAASIARFETIGVWTFEHSERTWSTIAPEPAPPERAGFSVVTGNSSMVLFGGYFLTIPAYAPEPSGVDFFGDLWCFDTRQMAWKKGVALAYKDGLSVADVARAYHGAVYLSGQQRMLIFGGYNTLGLSSDVLSWTSALAEDTCRGQLTRLESTPGRQHLPALLGHTATVMGDKVFIYGGCMEVNTIQQLPPVLFVFDVRANTWSNLSESVADGRVFHAAAAYGTKLIIAGGCHSLRVSKKQAAVIDFTTACTQPESLETILVLETTTMVWLKVKTDNTLASGNIFMHAMTVFDGYVHVFGGHFSRLSSSPGGSNIFRLRPGCPAGYFAANFSDTACKACDVNSYASSPGSVKCEACPGKAMTNQLAAVWQNACTTCQPNTCNQHGSCTVEPSSGVASCACNFGYTPSDNCLVPIYYLVIMLAILLQLGVIAVFVGVRKFLEYKHNEREKARQLRITRKEVSDLALVWEISYDEVTLRSRIDGNSPGGFGEVWLAEYRDMQVAVKKLQRHHYYSTFRQEFEREMEMMRKIRHPNIVLFLGTGKEPSTNLPFLVLEYMQKGALTEILHDPKVNIDHAQQIRFALDAAKGMRFLHSLTPPRIHRDLKSANLLVSERWVVKVADFGHARTVPDLGMTEMNTLSKSGRHMHVSWRNSGNTRHSNKQLLTFCEDEPLLDHQARMMTTDVGTLVWSSPELLSTAPYGASTDVYSFGIVLWELHARAEPFAEFSDIRFCSDFCTAVIGGRRPTIRDDCNRAYRKLIEECWQKDAEARPAFVEIVPRLDQQLEDWARGHMVTVS